ncbi:hypothetical protein H4Q32_014548 [Labeo rohita]|uniref:Uncharacterized protein n=1 Tax=Labeo rohita TaxID=84645 RepID=A0ABQ8LNI9_LABRO|nr:hypothetical protein H4Q32_014548 [Labeo rohita]
MAEGELLVDLGLKVVEGDSELGLYADLPPLIPPSAELLVSPVMAMETVCKLTLSPELSESPEAQKCPPTLPLLPPPPLSSGSPSAHPQPTIFSESRTPPWPVDPVAPPWLLAPSSPPMAQQFTGSLRLCLGLLSTICHLGTSRDSTPLAVAPSFQLCQSAPSLQLHLGPLMLRLHHGLPELRLHLCRMSHLLRCGPPDPPCHPGSWLSVSALSSSATCSAAVDRPPEVVSSFLHHGSFLGWLHRG